MAYLVPITLPLDEAAQTGWGAESSLTIGTIMLDEAIQTAKHDLQVKMVKYIEPSELDRMIRLLDRIGELVTDNPHEARAVCQLLSSVFEGIYYRLRGPYKNGPNAEQADCLFGIAGRFFKVYVDG